MGKNSKKNHDPNYKDRQHAPLPEVKHIGERRALYSADKKHIIGYTSAGTVNLGLSKKKEQLNLVKRVTKAVRRMAKKGS